MGAAVYVEGKYRYAKNSWYCICMFQRNSAYDICSGNWKERIKDKYSFTTVSFLHYVF
jgi:hypothetical protein